jgi:hypothetical protein
MTREFRSLLYSETALAWDISCAYHTFMRIISDRRLDRLVEVCRYRHEMRDMVAVAYNVEEGEAKSLLHAMTNGQGLKRWRLEKAQRP